MATLTGSALNPFRAAGVTPTNTGALNSPPSEPGPAVTTSERTQSAMAASSSTAERQQPTPRPTPPSNISMADDRLDEDLPPAYTPSADAQHGEATIEFGPARPFQPVPHRPPRPPQQSLPSQPSGGSQRLGSLWSQLTGQLQELSHVANDRVGRISTPNRFGSPPQRTGGSWPSYPGTLQQPLYSAPIGPPPIPARPVSHSVAPPPHHPTSLPNPPASAPVSENRTPSSEFARDFYAAGDSVPPELVSSSGNGASTSSGSASSAAGAVGKPTTTPTPGHPYLHQGKLLVYPKGFECEKCHNVGYKLPSMKPCKRCWMKYAKVYSGPLAYSFGQSTSTTASNFQRPLPYPTNPPSRPVLPPRTPGVSAPPGASSLATPFLAAPHPQVVAPTCRPQSMYSGRPPPGSVVYNAGDPRIGGRLCWRCDGKGTISLLIFDREQCPVCGGIGRTFPR